jgi:hypothetical protein
MARYENFIMSEDFLDKNKRAIFVFGDNTLRQGYGGAAALRDHPQTYGFITKKYPDNHDTSFYKPEDYNSIFFDELIKLRVLINDEPFKTFYVSQLGAGLANKYNIWEKVIKEGLENNLQQYPNVVFLWEQ